MSKRLSSCKSSIVSKRSSDQYTPSRNIVRPIPFKAHRIIGFTPELLESHYQDVYGGLIRKLNEIEAAIAALNPVISNAAEFQKLKRQQLTTANAVVLHEVYFDSLAEDGGSELTEPVLGAAIANRYGSFSEWQTEFHDSACALNAGSGWVLLVWSQRLGRLETVVSTDIAAGLVNSTPILAIDMDEHAYAADFGVNHTQYVQTFIKNINWHNVGTRFSTAKQLYDALQSTEESDPHQINVAQLKSLSDQNAEDVVILDVRHDDDRKRFQTRIMQTDWRDSFKVDSWAEGLSKDKPVVVYCMYGFWVSQKVAEELRAEGYDARSLTGGISAWHAMGFPTSHNI